MTQLRQLELMKRTRLMNARRAISPPVKPHNAIEEKDVQTAMYMLAYLGAIDMVLYDLEDDLQKEGLFKHTLKYNIGRARKAIANANGFVCTLLQVLNGGNRVRQYSDLYEYAYNTAQSCICVEYPNRSYSIFKALSRLFIEAHNKGGIKYKQFHLGDVVRILPTINVPQLQDKNIDFIITKAVQIIIRKKDEQ